MFWFLRLWFAHLLADFPFQTNLVFKLKKKSFWGVFLHATIFLFFALFLSIPYLNYLSAWIFIFSVWIFHIYLDWTRVKVSNLSQKQDNVWYFLLDQLEHLLSLSVVFFLPISKYPLFWKRPNLGDLWLRFYNSDYYILLAIGYIIVVFTGTILTFYVRKGLNSSGNFVINGIPTNEKYLEGLFKTILFLLFWFEIKYFYLISLVIILVKTLLDRYFIKIPLRISLVNTVVDIFLLFLIIFLLKFFL
ncbi:MAG: DUF3307 domain-containing protein [Dictyoglomaceae bacterium]